MGEETERERYIVVIRLPRRVEVRIEDTYLHLGGTTKPTLGYHITLLGPFNMDGDGGIHNKVRAVTEQLVAFTVQLGGLASFQSPNNNVVFLQLTNPTRVVATHRELLEALQDSITWSDPRFAEWMVTKYHPHVTLGLSLSDRELAEFLRIGASSRRFHATFRVTRMCLARQVPNGPWEFVAEFPFFGELPSRQPGSLPCAR
jgi:2'-5' RNA ligase